MSKDRICGVFDHEGIEYPFVLDDQIIRIPQIPFQYSDNFANIKQIDTLQGVTNNNHDIVFLGCKVLGNNDMPFTPEVILSVQGYILLTSSESSFDRIDFYSEAINGFYSPRNAYDVEINEDRTAIVGIKMRDHVLYKKDFPCQVNDEEFTLGLDIDLSVNLAWEKEQLGTAKSKISMSFDDKKRVNDLPAYYLYLRGFLEFVSFQKDIPLDRIELFEKSETGKYEKRGKAIIYQVDNSGYTPSAIRSITFPDVTDECFPKLFGQIAEKRLNNKYNPFLYPETRREDRRVDASKWLNTAVCFEGEFNTTFPDFRAKQDPAFHDAKALLLNAISEAVQQSGKSINNKQNKALSSFKSLIEHADTTIKQKFEVCRESYQYEMDEVIRRICSLYQVPKDTDLADVYATYRNQTAHGAVRVPGSNDVAAYVILRGFIYVMNLKRANVPAENIKRIISKMFYA